MSNLTAEPTDLIRKASPADAPACAQIVHRWLTETSFIETPPPLPELVHGFEQGIPRFDVWVTGCPIAGYLSFCPDEALVRGFYTSYPGSGVGKRLLDHVKKDRNWLQLWTHAPNIKAHRFYEREGFAFDGQTRVGSDGPEEWHMTWTRA